MEKDDDKRVLDGPISGSMRTDHPSPQSIANIRERYAIHDKMTAKKPAVPFDSVLAKVGRGGGGEQAASGEEGESTEAEDASASSATQTDGPASQSDTFERVTKPATPSRAPLPSARHPETPALGGKRKIIIKA